MKNQLKLLSSFAQYIYYRLQTFYTVKVSKVPSQTTIPRISPDLVIMIEMAQ
jgi:hypothetical protein